MFRRRVRLFYDVDHRRPLVDLGSYPIFAIKNVLVVKKMKKILLVFLFRIAPIISILLACFVFLNGCMGNSGNLSDGFTTESNTFNYILTNEAGTYCLHEIDKWKDSSSDALGVTTKCCGNQFWTSYNVAIMYTEKPEYLPENIIVCGK